MQQTKRRTSVFVGLFSAVCFAWIAPQRAEAEAAQREIAFVRNGNLWTVHETGKNPMQRTRTGDLHHVATDGERFAYVDDKAGDICVLGGPDWKAQRVTTKGAFDGTPCWMPNANAILTGRGRMGVTGDEGLWRIDVARRKARRILKPSDADLPINDRVRLSPRGDRIASFGMITMSMFLQVCDLASGKTMKQPGTNWIVGGLDVAWLDENNLLLAGWPGEYSEPGKGGLRRIDLRTRRISPWLYGEKTEVLQVERRPGGRQFAVAIGFQNAQTEAVGASHLEIVDARTKQRHRLHVPTPVEICGFSRDGKELLLLSGRAEDEGGDVYVLDMSSHRIRRVVEGATEALWWERRSAAGSAPQSPKRR